MFVGRAEFKEVQDSVREIQATLRDLNRKLKNKERQDKQEAMFELADALGLEVYRYEGGLHVIKCPDGEVLHTAGNLDTAHALLEGIRLGQELA